MTINNNMKRDLNLRKPTLASLILLNKFGVKIESGKEEDMLKYAYIHSHPGKDVNKLTMDEFNDAWFEFAEDLSFKDIPKLVEEIKNNLFEVEKSEFEILEDKGEKKPRATKQKA